MCRRWRGQTRPFACERARIWTTPIRAHSKLLAMTGAFDSRQHPRGASGKFVPAARAPDLPAASGKFEPGRAEDGEPISEMLASDGITGPGEGLMTASSEPRPSGSRCSWTGEVEMYIGEPVYDDTGSKTGYFVTHWDIEGPDGEWVGHGSWGWLESSYLEITATPDGETTRVVFTTGPHPMYLRETAIGD